MKQKFEEKVRSMTRKEIVMSVVNGLLAEHVEVDMGDFGVVRNGVCFGCAATNAVCEITGVKFTTDNIDNYQLRADLVGVDTDFIFEFESAIDCFRRGDIESYNYHAEEIGIAILPEADLPILNTSDWRENIHHYKTYADTL